MDINLYGAVPDSIVDGPGLRYAVFVQGCSHGCPGCHNPESQPREGGTLTTTDAVLAEIRANGLVRDVTLSGGEPFEQAAACAHLARQLKAEGYGVWTYTGYLWEDLARIAESAAKEVAKDAATAGNAAQDLAPAHGAASAGDAAPAKGIAPADGALLAHDATPVHDPAPVDDTAPAHDPAPVDDTAPAQDAAPTHGAASARGATFAGSAPQLDPAAVRDLLDNTDVLVDGPFVESLKSLSLKWCGSSNQRLVDVAATRAAGRVVVWEPPSFAFQKPPSW